MATQPWKPGWYTGQPAEHPRKDVVEMYYKKVGEAKLKGLQPYEPGKDYPELKEYNIIGR
jgi:hypothetical protein